MTTRTVASYLLVPQTVPRGEGVTPYRARLAPVACPTRVCGFDLGILVLRCHDFDVALAAVLEGHANGEISTRLAADLLGGYDAAHRLPHQNVWVRWVPDDYAHPDTGGAWERELRGTVGATPAVLFANPLPDHGRNHQS
jgi:hypothetical protein